MKNFLETFKQLQPVTQISIVIGLTFLLFLIAFNPVAATTIISFLVALSKLTERDGGTDSYPGKRLPPKT